MLEHRLAKLAAAATFVLLVIGGTVNPTGSSLACPEPTLVCHGQLFPPMVGGVLYEHGHRLAAMTVGLLQIALTFVLLRRGSRRLGWILLGLVIAQGALGAITVRYKLPWFVSTGHLLLGMSYFATLIYTAFRTRPESTAAELERSETGGDPDGSAGGAGGRAPRGNLERSETGGGDPDGSAGGAGGRAPRGIDQHARLRGELGGARRWIAVACGAVFVQLLIGALVRHLGAALVCLGMPSCTRSGGWWPEAGVQDLHMIHRGFGVVVAIVTTAAAIAVYRRARSWPALRLLALIAPALVVAQLALGIYTVLTVRAVPLAVGHFAGAVSLWALWMSAWLLTAPRRRVPAHALAADDLPALHPVGA